jgi:hypothetical protein
LHFLPFFLEKSSAMKRKSTLENNNGYALIAIMLVVVTLISAVFVLAYPLAHRSKEQAFTYNSEMTWHRFKYALFGRQVEQAGGLYGNSPGYVTDMQKMMKTGGGASPDVSSYFVARRYYNDEYTSENTDQQILEAPDWTFANGFWYGFRGKHYFYPPPSSQWEEINRYIHEEGTVGYNFNTRVCQSPLQISSNFLFATRERDSNIYLGTQPKAGSGTPIIAEVRDYGDDRNNRTLDNFRVVCGERGSSSYFFVPEQSDRQDTLLYTRYLFVLKDDQSGSAERLNFGMSGLMKLHIQVKELDGTWATRRTIGTVLPISMLHRFRSYASRDHCHLAVDYFD